MGSPDHPHCLRMVRTPLAHVGRTQSSFAPWLPSGALSGHVVQVDFCMVHGPMWAGPELSHVGFDGIWDPCGLAQIYPMWASGIWNPCGQAQIYPIWASETGPRGFKRYRSYIIILLLGLHIWGPFSPSGTQSSFASWHP